MSFESEQLDRMEALLVQSLKGLHFLFDSSNIKRILQKPTEELDFFNFKNMDRIQNLFTELLEKETIEEKTAFIQRLDPESYEILLRTYFHIVDNSARAAHCFKH